MKFIQINIANLFTDMVSAGCNIIKHSDGYELLDVINKHLYTKSINGDVRVKFLSRHLTPKHLIKISTPTNSVTVTSDHVCMVYNSDNFFENIEAKNLKVGDCVSTLTENTRRDYINKIEDLGTTLEYVYDMEVNDRSHCFYANNILIHNSQFVSVKCISDWMIEKYNLKKDICNWTQAKRLELWNIVSKLVDDEINPFVRNLVNKYSHTNNQGVLTYGLEYMADVGIYEQKKHYACHKIFEEGDKISKIKFSGIELKKATISPQVKEILNYAYTHVLTDTEWSEAGFRKFINESYERFCKLTIDEISLWKGYGAAREATGFLTMQKGSTSVASASTYFNQIINKLNLGRKYDEIRIGQKVRFCYIKENNEFGIKYIAFPDGQYPIEFNDIFKIDYDTMFEKCVMKPLASYMVACKFNNNIDPTNQPEFDVNDL